MERSPLPPSLRRVVDRLVRAFAPERLVLFGSYAKGTNHAESDVDLLIVADVGSDTSRPLRRARDLAADCYPPIDFVFAAPGDIAQAAGSRDLFLASILESGVTVYDQRADRE
jgi:predicted nucleotidyltransferase